jgi:hypothetical protein
MMDMDCTNCTQKGNVYTTTVPMVVLENERAHNAVIIRRLVRVIVLLIVLLAASVAFTVWRETQYETVSIEQDNDRGVNNFIGNDGDIYNGETENYLPQEKDR